MKCYWFVFCKTDIVLEKTADGYTIPLSEYCPAPLKAWSQVLDIDPMPDGTDVKAVNIDMPLTDNPSFEMCGLRNSYYKLPQAFYQKAGKCHELLYWNQNTRFCGVCGAPMKLNSGISKRCTNCGKEVWPQVSPAVIVLVHRGDEVLLVRANNFKDNHYGLVAGFVETGETFEEAVTRQSPLLRFAAVAVPQWRNGGLQRRLRRRRNTFAMERALQGQLVQKRQSARLAREAFNSPNADRQLA